MLYTTTVNILRTSEWRRLFLCALLYSILTMTNAPGAHGQAAEEEDWNSYIAQYEESPGSTTLNMALKEQAPLAAFPFCVVTGVVTKQCEEDGFPTQEEFEKLYQLGDDMEVALKATGQFVHVGTFTSRCERLSYFYVRDTANVRSKLLEFYKEKYPQYGKPYIGIKSDAAWTYYLEFLYPNEETLDFMSNEAVVQKLEEAGDKVEKPRAVDHWLYFGNKKDRGNFIQYATSQGYKVVSAEYVAEATPHYQLHLSKEHKVDVGSVSEVTLTLRRKAIEYNGDYDGWSTAIVKE